MTLRQRFTWSWKAFRAVWSGSSVAVNLDVHGYLCFWGSRGLWLGNYVQTCEHGEAAAIWKRCERPPGPPTPPPIL